jgi:hypothetical protein
MRLQGSTPFLHGDLWLPGPGTSSVPCPLRAARIPNPRHTRVYCPQLYFRFLLLVLLSRTLSEVQPVGQRSTFRFSLFPLVRLRSNHERTWRSLESFLDSKRSIPRISRTSDIQISSSSAGPPQNSLSPRMCEFWTLIIIALRIALYHSPSQPIQRIPRKKNNQSFIREDSDKETESDRIVKN